MLYRFPNPYFMNPGGLSPGSCSQAQHLQGCTPVYNAGRWWCSCLSAPPPSPQKPGRAKMRRSNPGPRMRSLKKIPHTMLYQVSQWLSMEPMPTKLSERRLTSLSNPCGCARR